MPRTNHASLPALILALTLASACFDDAVRPSNPVEVPAPAYETVRLSLWWVPPLTAGSTITMNAWAYDRSGSQIAPPRVTWRSTDTTVLAIVRSDSARVELRAAAPGIAGLVASAGPASARLDIRVDAVRDASVPVDTGLVEIVDFHFMEFENETGWLYVPSVTLRTRDASPIEILGMRFAIPGVPALPACETVRTVTGTETALFRESYGEWELAFGSSMRHTGGATSMLVVARVPSGATLVVAAEGPVRPGTLPTGSSGDPGVPWSCSAP